MHGDAGLRMGAADWLLLLLLSVLWGASFFFGKVAVSAVPPLTTALVQVAAAALALRLWMRSLGEAPALMGEAPYWVLGLFNNVIPFALELWALTRISSGLAAILNATSPLWGAVLAHVFTRDERLAAGKVLGVLIGVAGVAVISGQAVIDGMGGDTWAQVAMVLATLSYGIAGVYSRKLTGTSPWRIAAGQLSTSAAMLLPLAAWMEHPWTLPTPPASAWGALAGLALLSTALGYGIYFKIIARAGATNALLVTLLMPISTLVLGRVVLGEPIVPRQLGGMSLILLGLVILEGRLAHALWAALPKPDAWKG